MRPTVFLVVAAVLLVNGLVSGYVGLLRRPRERQPRPAHRPTILRGPGGTVIGFRGWRLDDDGRLRSLHGNEEWIPSVPMTARCIQPHDAPARDCGYGIYALFAPARSALPLHVTGIVEAWGPIQLHEWGFRAHRARPIALLATGHPSLDAAIAGTASRYRIRVVRAGDAIGFASRRSG